MSVRLSAGLFGYMFFASNLATMKLSISFFTHCCAFTVGTAGFVTGCLTAV